MKPLIRHSLTLHIFIACLLTTTAFAQGTRSDYERALSLDQLLRSLGMANVLISQNCIRSLVTNGCMTVFMDDQYFGQVGFSAINVRDIEFIAVIGPTEALTTYGNRAQHGVVMLYTTRPDDRRLRRP